MRRQTVSPVLGAVIGGAIGALIGLCFIKFTPWGIPAGAVLGVVIGLIVASSSGSRGTYTSGADGADVVATGCMALSCLGDLVSCMTIAGVLLTGIIAGIIALVH